MTEWPFEDPPNVAVFTCLAITSGEDWVHYVSHDLDDGAWQFHTSDPDPVPDDDVRIVALKRITEIDPSVCELFNLPCGWHAWRDTPESEWNREPKE